MNEENIEMLEKSVKAYKKDVAVFVQEICRDKWMTFQTKGGERGGRFQVGDKFKNELRLKCVKAKVSYVEPNEFTLPIIERLWHEELKRLDAVMKSVATED